MNELQFFLLGLLVVVPSLITWFVTNETHDRNYKSMVRQYRDAMETLGQANRALRDEKQELIDELSLYQQWEKQK
jgi:hypothetical protein